MTQLTVHLTTTEGDDFGFRKVTTVNWNSQGEISTITVDWGSPFYMFYSTKLGVFVNDFGNIHGTLIKESSTN